MSSKNHEKEIKHLIDHLSCLGRQPDLQRTGRFLPPSSLDQEQFLSLCTSPENILGIFETIRQTSMRSLLENNIQVIY